MAGAQIGIGTTGIHLESASYTGTATMQAGYLASKEESAISLTLNYNGGSTGTARLQYYDFNDKRTYTGDLIHTGNIKQYCVAVFG